MPYEPGAPEFNPPFEETDELGEIKKHLEEVPIDFDERGSANFGHDDTPSIDRLPSLPNVLKPVAKIDKAEEIARQARSKKLEKELFGS